VGVEDRFPQRPHFLQLHQFFLLRGAPFSQSHGIVPHGSIDGFFIDTVGGTVFFAAPVIPLTDILHTTLAVPVPKQGYERIPAIPAEKKPRISMDWLLRNGWSGLLF